MSILILGGTSFLGPHVVECARDRGHSVTLFNRGRTNPGLFPDVEKLAGDRDPRKERGLAALEGDRCWDAVVDTSGYVPRIVLASAQLLAGRVGQYVFVSSISVYADNSIVDMDESGPIATMPDETVEEMGPQFENYGPLKALCEKAAEEALPGRATSVRPGLIVGPRDNAPRFAYWPARIEQGGEVLAPGAPDDPVQFIDVRDLAAFIVGAIETRMTGVFNATGPVSPMCMAEMLYGCKAVTGGDALLTWVDAAFIESQGLRPWVDLPVWIPPEGETAGFHRVNCRKAIAAGLTTRPLARTVEDTLRWLRTPESRKPAGIARQREAEVLAAWHAREG
jgi:2'-hydroxyisoflavone reductase